jgi:hypothetical protein
MEPLDFQRPALTEIVARARAFFAFHQGEFRDIRDSGLQPRWATLLVAPTGAGKTTTAEMASKAVGAKMLRLSAPSYMPCGAHNRGSKETIGVIAEHVAKYDRTLLVADEVDKINDVENAWHGYIRNELLFDLMGGNWPTGLNLPDLDDCPNITIDELTKKLRTTVFFLAIGTFQEWYESTNTRRAIGFGATTDTENDEITADIIAQKLPREMVNRFGKIVRLPELKEKDYRQIAKEAEKKLPVRIREKYSEEVSQRIAAAIRDRKGVRFLEEALTAVLINIPKPEHTPSNHLTLDEL